MGWWRITDEGGGIDWTNVTESNGSFGFANAMRGKNDPETELFNGDDPADIMGPAVDGVSRCYEEYWGRKPRMVELHACLEFVARGRFDE